MHFLPFIDFYGYKVSNKILLNKAIKAYFQSPRLKPYYDALLRNGAVEQQQDIKHAVDELVNEILEARSQIDSKQYLDWMSVWDEMSKDFHSNSNVHLNSSKTIRQKYLPIFYNSHVRKILLDKQSQIDIIESQLKSYSSSILDSEHFMATERLDSKRIVSFSEYLDEVWGLSAHKNGNFNPTFLQWKYYLSYIESRVRPFANMQLHTENKHQACMLLEKIRATINKVNSTEERFIEISNIIFKTKERISNNRVEWAASHACATLYKDNSGRKNLHEAIAYSLDLEHHDLLLALDSAQSQLPALDDLCCTPAGMLATESDIYKMCENQINYWMINYSQFIDRQRDMMALEVHAKSECRTYTDILRRYISQRELDRLKQSKQFMQSPNSLEREKWFFESNGCPGNGVTKEFVCDIHLKTGSISLFHRLLRPDGERATVVFKENEQHCIGFHEDALPLFNRMIDKLTIYKQTGNSRRKILEIPFRRGEFQDDVPALTFMFNNMNIANGDANVSEPMLHRAHRNHRNP